MTLLDHISLHDSPVKKVELKGDQGILELDWALLTPEHPANPHGLTAIAHDCRLEMNGIGESVVRLWDDKERIWLKHPAAHQPLDREILDARCEPLPSGLLRFHFEGWYQGAFCEWDVMAAGATFGWKSSVDVWK